MEEIGRLTLERDSLARQLDDMSMGYAQTALVNEELRARLAWYQRVLRKTFGHDVVAHRIGELLGAHPLNSIS